MESELNDYMQQMKVLTDIYRTLPMKAATLAVNFSKERFRQQNWLDLTPAPWQQRKLKTKSKRAILVLSGTLKRDVHKIYVTPNAAMIGTSTLTKNYAQIHNEGGTVKATQRVKPFTRKQFTRIREGRKENVGKTNVKAFTRKINFTMPQRRYLGISRILDTRIEDMMVAELIKPFQLKQ
jgi:phage gpG-like protein